MFLNRCVHLVISVILITGSVSNSVALAQSANQSTNQSANQSDAQNNNPALVDLTPPIIELQESPDGTAGENQVFTALVADDHSLKDVRLYYRYTGQQAFTAIEMQPLVNTSYYTASISTIEDDTRSIEYYIQARDNGGNRVVHGYAFDPLVRTLNLADAPATQVNAAQSSGGFNWWYVALGVLATGAIIGLSRSSSSESPDTQPLVPFTVGLTTPQL